MTVSFVDALHAAIWAPQQIPLAWERECGTVDAILSMPEMEGIRGALLAMAESLPLDPGPPNPRSTLHAYSVSDAVIHWVLDGER